MKTIFCCLIWSLSALVSADDVNTDDLSLTARRAIDQYKAEVGRLKERYLEIEKRERKDLLKTLEQEIEKQTKRGDLDAALKVRKLIGEVKSGKFSEIKPQQAELTREDLISGKCEYFLSITNEWRKVDFASPNRVITETSAKGIFEFEEAGKFQINFESGVKYSFSGETNDDGYYLGKRSKGGKVLLRIK